MRHCAEVKESKPQKAADWAGKLKAAGVRPTRQRLAVAAILFDGEPKHMTAEQVYDEACKRKIHLVLATVYNTLNQFKAAGLLRELSIDSTCRFYDTNCTIHGHAYDAKTGALIDLPPQSIPLPKLPSALAGRKATRIDVMVWLDDK